jgi:type I restriction enzyme S subunit
VRASHDTWQEGYRLGVGCRIKHGYAFKGEGMTTEGDDSLPVVVNIVNFQYTGGFRFDSTKIQRYVATYPREYELTPGDVLLVMTCQTPKGEILGVPGRVPGDGKTYLHNQRMGLVILQDEGALDLGFLYYLFLSPAFNAHLFKTATGAKILHTAPGRIEDFQFSRPPLTTQRRIASILSAYDDLIENNMRRIKILEEMAQMLYREWFVHFRFPGHENVPLVESELGPIPEGWTVGRVGDLLTLHRDGITPAEFPDEIFQHFSLPAFDATGLPIVERGEAIQSGKYLLVSECLLFSKLNPRIPRLWWPEESGSYRQVSSTEFLVVRTRESLKRAFLYHFLVSPQFQDRFTGLALGTSTSHQRVKPDDFLTMPAVLPPTGIVCEFNRIAEPVMRQIAVLRSKNANLRTTRDLLLPKLISGELSVESLEEAEAMV